MSWVVTSTMLGSVNSRLLRSRRNLLLFENDIGRRLPACYVVRRARATQSKMIEVVSDFLADAIDVRLQQKHSTDELESRMEYAKGDFVLVHRKKAIQGDKLKPPFDGPYEVMGPGSSGSASYLLRAVIDSRLSEEHRDEMKLFLFRDMSELVKTAKAGKGYKDVDRIISHTGSKKTGARAYSFRVRYERPFDRERFDEDLSWKDVNRTNAYNKYRDEHPEYRLPESEQGEVEGPWSESDDGG